MPRHDRGRTDQETPPPPTGAPDVRVGRSIIEARAVGEVRRHPGQNGRNEDRSRSQGERSPPAGERLAEALHRAAGGHEDEREHRSRVIGVDGRPQRRSE